MPSAATRATAAQTAIARAAIARAATPVTIASPVEEAPVVINAPVNDAPVVIASTDVPTDCDICTDPFNNSTRKVITCVRCDLICCKRCFIRYVADPEHYLRCMGCGVDFDRTSLSTRLGKSFMATTFRDIRQAILYEQEKALFPATQELVEQEKKRIELRNQRDDLDGHFEKIRQERKKPLVEFRTSETTMPAKEALDMYFAMLCNVGAVDSQLQEARVQLDNEIANLGSKSTKRTYVLTCPATDCKGMLSSENVDAHGRFNCAICSAVTCQNCQMECAPGTSATHECDADILATIKFVRESSKPCPSCGVSIHKTMGCFAKNTPILMWLSHSRRGNQTIKMSQDVKVGDRLVGDDGKPRTVQRLCTGEDEMFEVRQAKGMSYTVSSKHNLVLKRNSHDDVVEMPVDEFMKLTDRQKSLHLGFKSGAPNKTQITVTPIGVGTYYGWEVDGNHRFVAPDMTVLKNCDQMFCTSCHASFEWKTGRINNGAVHNPYHAQWIRENRGRAREVGDVQCGREIGITVLADLGFAFESLFATASRKDRAVYKAESDYLFEAGRMAIHVHHVTLPALARSDTHLTNQRLRMNLLMGRISEAEFRSEIQRVDKAASKKNDMLHVCQLYRDSFTDVIWPFVEGGEVANTVKGWLDMIEQIRALERYVNNCFENIASSYGSKQITRIMTIN